MNAIWIAFIAVFAALIPVFIFAAQRAQQRRQMGTTGSDALNTPAIDGSSASRRHDDASDDGDGGDGGGSD